MELDHLPTRTADAAGNMAADFLLLQRYPDMGRVRFRHYDWRRPAFTFGYAQKVAIVRSLLPFDDTLAEPLDLARRPTGGGIVDHREDWTYALVLPRGHALFDRPGATIYRRVHEALTAALNTLGADVKLQEQAPEEPPGMCFQRPEIDDVVRIDDRRKVAGAALKRSKHGVLLQGSVWKPAAGGVNWDELEHALAVRLGEALQTGVVRTGWPAFEPEDEEALIAQFASQEWTDRR